MSYLYILYDVKDHVATITLNRPEKLNAVHTQLRDEVCAALKVAEYDDEVRAIVIKGAGRAFSSGADITGDPAEVAWLTTEDGKQMNRRYRREFTAQWLTHIWDNEKPVVAQIHGYCLGAGADMANACDFIIAAHDTKIGFPEARFGGVLMAMLPWTVGMRRAKELLMTGGMMTAEECFQVGMINRLAPLEELDATVAKFVDSLVKVPTETTYFGKMEVNRCFEIAGLKSAISQSYDLNALCKLTRGGNQEWGRIRREKGMKAALEWRDGPFREE